MNSMRTFLAPFPFIQVYTRNIPTLEYCILITKTKYLVPKSYANNTFVIAMVGTSQDFLSSLPTEASERRFASRSRLHLTRTSRRGHWAVCPCCGGWEGARKGQQAVKEGEWGKTKIKQNNSKRINNKQQQHRSVIININNANLKQKHRYINKYYILYHSIITYNYLTNPYAGPQPTT